MNYFLPEYLSPVPGNWYGDLFFIPATFDRRLVKYECVFSDAGFGSSRNA